MKNIPLTQGKYAIVDDEDYEYLNQWKWHYDPSTRGYGYARSDIKGKMHRLILKAPRGLEVDHINHNTLDNRKENLRLATSMQNQQNKTMQKNNTSGFRGVSWSQVMKRWLACIYKTEDGKQKRYDIGYFEYKIDAAKAYNKKAIELFGKFAYLNKIPLESR